MVLLPVRDDGNAVFFQNWCYAVFFEKRRENGSAVVREDLDVTRILVVVREPGDHWTEPAPKNSAPPEASGGPDLAAHRERPSVRYGSAANAWISARDHTRFAIAHA